MLRSIDFKTMPYLFTDKAGTCLTVEFDGRELDDIYKQVKAMYDQAHSSDDMPTEPGWYATRDGEDLLSYDGDAWHIHNIDCDAQLFVDGDLETMDWSVVKRTFDADDAENGSNCIDVRGDFTAYECRIELHDGRTVTCINFNTYKGGGGLSCDWNNASGKDGETK